jgi:hypothetical protein
LCSEKTGVLPAGHYTFSGVIDGQGVGSPGAAQDFTGSGGYNVVLTVAPEPAMSPAPRLSRRR